MLHEANIIEYPYEHSKLLLKVFSIFKMKIIYDETIDKEYVPEAVSIICINCGKFIRSSLDNQKRKYFITPFVKNIVL